MRTPQFVLDDGPRPDIYAGQLRFLRAAAAVPNVIDELAQVATDDDLQAWGKRFALDDDWCMHAARSTVEAWTAAGGADRWLERRREKYAHNDDWRELGLPEPTLGFLVTTDINYANVLDGSFRDIAEGIGVLVDDEPPLEFSCRAYYPLSESSDEYLEVMCQTFKAFLREHVESRNAEAIAMGAQPAKKKRSRKRKDGIASEDRHFAWLARFQCGRESIGSIAASAGVHYDTVQDSLRETADLIGLTRHTTRPSPE